MQSQNNDRFVITRQFVIDALLENVEKALGRMPVKNGKEGAETFVYRGDVANTAIRLAGLELGLFTEKPQTSHEIMDMTEARPARSKVRHG